MSAEPIEILWYSPDGVSNASMLRAAFPEAFYAMSILDALGHRLVHRATKSLASRNEQIISLVFLRRLVTLFVGMRHLLASSAVEPAKLLVRAQFELMLATRYLVFGGQRYLTPDTPTTSRGRNARARYYQASAIRAGIYRIQGAIDGEFGVRKPLKGSRATQEAAVRGEIEKLERRFPVQHRAFGPLACFKVGKRKRYFDEKQWYSFGFRSSRVNSIQALAERLGHRSEYHIFYSPLSGMIHPKGLGHDTTVLAKAFGILSPYMADAFPILCHFCCRWQLRTLGYLIRTRPGSSENDWIRVRDQVEPVIDELDISIPDGFFG